MSDAIISVENLSKKYVIGHQRGKGDGLRHAVEAALRSPLRWLRGRARTQPSDNETFWALKDVSFDIKQGEVVGIIGRNGAGKSTLLKILSRITEPTNGRIIINGRVASLLEVGTGFHQELTGRENIFLNGAILGMSRVEIKRKFDEIVAFSEVERFLDTPVKRYSSGMYVRLAFAVAAHLEPEILIVDEVLAVGDQQFQQKCLGKMKNVSQSGRTILFVSHNMNAVQKLCSKAIVLKSGQVEYWGTVDEAITKHSSTMGMQGIVTYSPDKLAKTRARICQLEIMVDGRTVMEPLQPGAEVLLNFNLTSECVLAYPKLTVGISNKTGERVFAVGTPFGQHPLPSLSGDVKVGIRFIMPPILPGVYQLDVGLYDQHEGTLQEIYAAGSIEVADTNYLEMIGGTSPDLGHVLVRSTWVAY